MDNAFSFYAPIVFVTNTLLPLRFVSPSSLNLFNKSIKNGIKVKRKAKVSTTSQSPAQGA